MPSRWRPGTGRAGPVVAAAPSSGEVAAGVVEVAPAVAITDHPLDVLAPDDVVVKRVAHDRADDAAGDVTGPERAIAEVRGQGEAVRDHRDRLRRGQRATRLLEARAAVVGDAVAQL